MTYQIAKAAVKARHLDIFGAFHPVPQDQAAPNTGTILLLGPKEPGFWPVLKTAPEWDGQPDPIDRWSQRVISEIAAELGGTPLFPFGGPPYQPFIGWALRSGRAWQSPVTILVHDQAGLMVSYRGAIALPDILDLPERPAKPCETCAKPCLSACPVDALGPEGYDVDACHTYLDTNSGQDCLDKGCQVRRACPVSQSYGRVEAQSAYHMGIFHKGAFR